MKDDLQVEKLLGKRKINPRKVAQHIIKDHGILGFNKLIEMFQRGVDGESIGEIFGVTRQRVCQWKKCLGNKVTTFEPDACIQDLVRVDMMGTKRTVV